jgi:hypothetical protein
MQDWVDRHFALVFPLYFVGLWIFVNSIIALIGGWRLLARRFRMQGSYDGQKWPLQSARMRWTAHYNGVLTVGANRTGLFIAPLILFRVGHPPLFVPWVEIVAVRKTIFFFFNFVELRLGRSEEIPFTISAKLAAPCSSPRVASAADWLKENVTCSWSCLQSFAGATFP